MRAPLISRVRRVAATAALLAAASASAHAQQAMHSVARVAPATSDTALAATSTASDASAAIAAWVGVYRLTLAGKAGAMLDTRVMVERFGDRLSGVLLVDQQASGLSDVRVDDDALSMAVNTAEGRGRLVLRRTADGVAGTLTVGRRVWAVAGAQSI